MGENYENLLNGYIRIEITKDNKRYCPEALIFMMIQFLGNIFRIFDACPDGLMHTIQNKGFVVYRSANTNKNESRHLYGCSKGFEPNTGKYAFNIKIAKLSNKISFAGPDSIGVISKKKWFEKTNLNLDNIQCNSYYLTISRNYHNYDHRYYWIRSGSKNKQSRKGRAMPVFKSVKSSINICAGDVITIHIDTHKWKLYFRHNGKRLCDAFNIVEDMVYYPVIGSINIGNEYQIVSSFSVCHD